MAADIAPGHSLSLLEHQWLMASLVPGLINQAIAMGFRVKLGEALRSPEEAARLAKTGAGIAHSLHILGLAIDLLLFKDDTYLTSTEDYKPLGVWWEQQHPLCCWGGRFTRADGDHFSITYGGLK